MAREYCVAMIGCGKRGRAHALGLQADLRCRVTALADANLEAAQALNHDFGFGAKTYTDYREMLAAEKPEVVVSCLWTPLHLPVFRDCVAAGVRAVLSEKPMAPTWG
ncbi:MAG: Gfo/Idh/MocA family oxidoreductase, partial [Armatimonadota bacterium]|nr:Gfo/Idh/MocA family oxidoreductase [Armatimonadota bacterium]